MSAYDAVFLSFRMRAPGAFYRWARERRGFLYYQLHRARLHRMAARLRANWCARQRRSMRP
jgi:hypothetical protein